MLKIVESIPFNSRPLFAKTNAFGNLFLQKQMCLATCFGVLLSHGSYFNTKKNYWRNCWILKKLRWTFGYSCRYAVAGSMGLMLLKLEQNQRLKVFQTSQTQLRLVLRCHLLHQWNFRIFASLTSPGETHGSFKTSGLHVNIRGRQELALQTFFPILPKFL